METRIPKLLSQAEAARLANLPASYFMRLVKSEKIVPDFMQGKTLLFQPATAQKIKEEFGQ
jgi:hypothetical protein